MNEVDTERFRLHVRSTIASFALVALSVVSAFVIIDIIRIETGHDYSYLVLAFFMVVVLRKPIEKRVTKFFEKRLFESKNRNHTL